MSIYKHAEAASEDPYQAGPQPDHTLGSSPTLTLSKAMKDTEHLMLLKPLFPSPPWSHAQPHTHTPTHTPTPAHIHTVKEIAGLLNGKCARLNAKKEDVQSTKCRKRRIQER